MFVKFHLATLMAVVFFTARCIAENLDIFEELQGKRDVSMAREGRLSPSPIIQAEILKILIPANNLPDLARRLIYQRDANGTVTGTDTPYSGQTATVVISAVTTSPPEITVQIFETITLSCPEICAETPEVAPVETPIATTLEFTQTVTQSCNETTVTLFPEPTPTPDATTPAETCTGICVTTTAEAPTETAAGTSIQVTPTLTTTEIATERSSIGVWVTESCTNINCKTATVVVPPETVSIGSIAVSSTLATVPQSSRSLTDLVITIQKTPSAMSTSETRSIETPTKEAPTAISTEKPSGTPILNSAQSLKSLVNKVIAVTFLLALLVGGLL
ncbi:hypothetical protein N7462_009562 [Penicillium macrosclerotiorum]|uniref:uncharacterized protein n=1 Tax=Penicillium macrosclerotiorum TaxID=303699 RepID=UPI002548DFF2|nr:uncharacterized protein N7462_009562 [Penicillium macrosclerotiorum]KAJ5674123.1 hypothetical protein N7462_009562 [Penicillium macrosclerotiorum]